MRFTRTEKTIKIHPDSVLAKCSAKRALLSCPFHWVEHRSNWNRTKALLGMRRFHGTYAVGAGKSNFLMSAFISGTFSIAQISQRNMQKQNRLLKKRKHHTSKVPVPTLIFTCLGSLMTSDWALTTALLTLNHSIQPHSSSLHQGSAKKKKNIKTHFNLFLWLLDLVKSSSTPTDCLP